MRPLPQLQVLLAQRGQLAHNGQQRGVGLGRLRIARRRRAGQTEARARQRAGDESCQPRRAAAGGQARPEEVALDAAQHVEHVGHEHLLLLRDRQRREHRGGVGRRYVDGVPLESVEL